MDRHNEVHYSLIPSNNKGIRESGGSTYTTHIVKRFTICSNIANTIELSSNEISEIAAMARSTSLDYRYVQRAKVIIFRDEGNTIDETRNRLDMSWTNINQWRRRFEALRINGLKDAPRSGHPLVISAATRTMVIEIASSKPTDGTTLWSQRRIARKCAVGQTSVHEILREADLKPHNMVRNSYS